MGVAKALGKPTIDDPVWERAHPVLQAEIGRGKKYAAGKVAEALGVSPAAVSQWASGKNRPEMRNLLRVWKHIGRDPSELYAGADAGALGLIRKLETVAAKLGVSADRMLTLWSVTDAVDEKGEAYLNGLPDEIRRAAMAVVHLEDCSVGEALQAAWVAWQDLQQQPGTLPGGWVMPITQRLSRKKQSGLRKSVRSTIP